MSDPRILSLISLLFAVLGSYSLYMGSRQLRDARRSGRPLRWYRNIAFLTGCEYIILTFVFLLRIANLEGSIAPGMQGLVLPLYYILLIAAALTAVMVVQRGIFNAMNNRRARLSPPEKPASTQPLIAPASSPDDARQASQRQRERRKKAAAARRRHAGRA